MSIAEWDNEYARMVRAASQLRTTGIHTSVHDANSLQQNLRRLENNLEQLPLSTAETQRRQRLIQHLRQTTNSNSTAPATARSSTGSSTAAAPMSQMQFAMQQQDNMIEDLAMGMDRLKHQTVAIHDESRLHVNLLSNMDTNLDMARDGLEEETRRATQLRQDQSVWRLQLIVAGLSILLVLLILLGLSP